MKVLSKEQILKANDLNITKVSVPAWGGDVHIRLLTGKERDEYENYIYSLPEDNIRGLRLKLVFMSLCEQDGKRMFDSEEDFELLASKSSDVITDLFKESQKLNAINSGGIEESLVNSETDQNEDSTSD